MCEKTEQIQVKLQSKEFQLEFLLPLIASNLVNAFYSSLVLKKLSGIDVGNPEIWKETRTEVLGYFDIFEKMLQQHGQLNQHPSSDSTK